MNDCGGGRHDELSTRVVRSGGWLYVQKFAGGAIRIGATSILARVLAPADFGVVALAQVILGFLMVVGSGGVMEFVIADRHPDRRSRLDAAFWSNLVLAVAVSLLTMVVIVSVDAVSHAPLLQEILSLLVVRYLLEQFSVVPEGLIRATLEYRRLTMADVGLALISALLSIALVLTGWGVWSLVIPLVIEYGLKSVWYFSICDWIPTLRPGFRHWKEILEFSAHIRFTMMANMVASEGDTLIVGRMLGSGSLGVYSMAYQTSTFVKRGFVTALGSLVLPALVHVGTEREALARAMQEGARAIALLTYPLLAVMFITAGNLVGVLYGPQWGEAVLPLRILLLFAFIHCLSSPATAVYNVIGRPNIGSRVGIVLVPVYLVAVVVGVHWGITGTAVAVTAVRVVFGLVQVREAARVTKQSMMDLIRPLVPVVSLLLPLVLVTAVVQALLRHVLGAGQFVSLFGASAAALTSCAVLLRTTHRQLAHDLHTIMGSFSSGKGRWMHAVTTALGSHPARPTRRYEEDGAL